MSRAKDLALRAWAVGRPLTERPTLWLNVHGHRGFHRGVVARVDLCLYLVYRHRNAALVHHLVRGLPAGARVHLHALDLPSNALLPWTIGAGPGARIPLLQGMIESHPPAAGEWVVIADDDVSFVGTGAARFLGYAATGQFDIAQPAHQPHSHHSFRVTRVVAGSTARETRFVEVGPVVALSPRVRDRVLPFPGDARMGWGLDVRWSRLRDDGFRLGVIDATPVVHHEAVAAAYDRSGEYAAQRRHLDEAAVESPHELDANVGLTWRPWQTQPRWVSGVA